MDFERWRKQLQPIIDDWKNWINTPVEPLDDDDVDILVENIRNQININEGNI